jgi:hypothetical protein
MGGICRFLEIAPDDRVLAPTKLGTPVSANTSYDHDRANTTIVASQIGRFHEVLAADEIRFIEDLLRRQMAACGFLAAAVAPVEGPRPRLPGNAARSWKSRGQVTRAWQLQRALANRPLPFSV